MEKKEILKKIENNKIDVFELIEILYEQDKYNFEEEDIWEIEDNVNYQIEELGDILKLEKIKMKMIEYNMNIDLVEKNINRRKPLKNSDINKFDIDDLEYYIYDGFDMLTSQQRLMLLKKAKELKIEKGDIEYLLDQIQECNEEEQEKYIINTESDLREEENPENLFNILDSLFSSNKKENVKTKSDYETYQFEEEELEEDDYYYEDID